VGQPLSGTKRALSVRSSYPHRALKHRATVAAWRSRNPDHAKAHAAVAYAVKRGRLTPGPCIKCGATSGRFHAHHDDYSKPLAVEWFCVSCHRLTHTGGKKKPPRQPRPPQAGRFGISKSARGWVKRIDGKPTWICSDKVAPDIAAADAYYEAHFLAGT
jgi:hypothetical protein